MNRRDFLSKILFLSLVPAVAPQILALFSSAASAHGYDLGSIHIDHPWARATPKGANIGGGYMKITNRGMTPDRLVGGSTSVAGGFAIHKMTMEHDVMKMRPMEHGVEIKPGATVDLGVESFHIMFEGLKQPLEQGQRIKGKLVFEKAGSIEVEYEVEGIGAKSAMPEEPDTHGH
jgi:copper(I)-binding protein